jgi:beta-mannosidase
LINATIEAEQQVERLSKYACIALWCGNNEISEGWHRWGWQDELTAEGVQTIWNDYQSLFDNILPIVVDKYSNVTDYWQSSPMFGRGDPGFNKQGDAHDWGLWHDELPFETIKKRVPRFMSEFGIQSLPEMETFEKVIPEDELHIDSSLLQSRQKHIRGNSIIKKYIEDECPYPSDLNALIFLSQYIQAEGMGNLITSHRMAKPYCMGSLYWQFNDCWPAISWSGMDYYGNWKAFQYKVKQVFQDVLLSASVEDERIVVKAVSDLFYHDTVICELFFQDFSGNPIFYDQWKNIIPPNTATTLYSEEIPFKDLQFSDSYYILLKWRRDNKEYAEVQLLDKLKNLKLPDPELSISSLEKMENGYRFHISAKHLAKSVELKSNFPIHFMPNYFDLNPGETIEVRCKTDIEEFDASQINIRSLFNFIK